jgi:hypothetical protein
MKPVDVPREGTFGQDYALSQDYGAIMGRYLEHGTDQARGGVPEHSWAAARDRAGAANVEAWWQRYHRATRSRYASREVAVAFFSFIAGLLLAGAIVYFH